MNRAIDKTWLNLMNITEEKVCRILLNYGIIIIEIFKRQCHKLHKIM